jgi:hypothetical protein
MESSLVRMVAVPLLAGRIRSCLPELRFDERVSLPLTPIDAYRQAGLTRDDVVPHCPHRGNARRAH